MPWYEIILNYIQSGLGSLAAYLAAHVLLCLLPAFFIAGALSALFPKEAVTRYLGKDAKPWFAYPAAALGGFVLAVCSCTIMPLFASIYKKGAGLGPAITFLFVGPAINILAISFTGVQLGMDIAIARLVLSLLFGIAIGLLMACIFRKEESDRQKTLSESKAFHGSREIPRKIWIFFAILLVILMAGTLQVKVLTNGLAPITLEADWVVSAQQWLDAAIPPNASLGIEGVSFQGLVLIGLLVLIAITAYLGLNHVDQGYNVWSGISLLLVSATLLVASLRVNVVATGLTVALTGKMILIALMIAALWWLATKHFESQEIQDWLWESWRFVKQIIPLLLIGVFVAGIARQLIPASWVQSIAGKNTLMANFVGVIFGVFMYFPTLVEVPVAQTFLSLGMHRGPLLAYLLADPELSLQSILITNSVIGKKKTAVYVSLVAVFSTLAGYLFGVWLNWV